MDVAELLAKVDDSVHVGRSFGPPIERDGITVVPVAWVAGASGAGGGTGSDGEGTGGGWGGVSWPLGVYEIRDGSVRWVPALDVTRVAVAAIALARALARRRRRRG